MRALIAALALAASAASAGEVTMLARQGEDSARLFNAQCTNADVLKRLKDEYKDQFRRAVMHAEGKDWDACWIEYGSSVYVFYPDGDKALIPMSDFKPDDGA